MEEEPLELALGFVIDNPIVEFNVLLTNRAQAIKKERLMEDDPVMAGTVDLDEEVGKYAFDVSKTVSIMDTYSNTQSFGKVRGVVIETEAFMTPMLMISYEKYKAVYEIIMGTKIQEAHEILETDTEDTEAE